MAKKRRVTILDLLTDKVDPRGTEALFLKYIGRQYYSIMPQVAAAWCRRRGHEVRYETYYGQTQPHELIDPESDIVFISAYTRASALAYSLAKLVRKQGARSVLGGPHATCFPEDATRFFDHVVTSCTETQVIDLVEERVEPGRIISSGKGAIDLPSLAERQADVEKAACPDGKRTRLSTVSLLTSTGCPYSCSFCSDWDSVYAARGTAEVAEDLKTAATAFPSNIVAFHDPNFGVRFDQTLNAFESVDPKKRNPYVVESSLSLLRSDRITRLAETNCAYLAPGVESWYDYGDKAKTSAAKGQTKFDQVCEKFAELSDKIPSLQANFLIADESDEGLEPIELTKAFVSRFPGVFPVINFPMAFGATPLRDQLAAEGRLLPLPSIHYSSPVMTHLLANYSFREALENKIALIDHILSPSLFAKRMARKCPLSAKIFWTLFLLKLASYKRELRGLVRLLDEDQQFLAFHEGRDPRVPRYYDERLDRRLGRYAGLLPAEDRALAA
ncbi:MAG: radical SAM protein [Pseudomonadota bacterium]